MGYRLCAHHINKRCGTVSTKRRLADGKIWQRQLHVLRLCISPANAQRGKRRFPHHGQFAWLWNEIGEQRELKGSKILQIELGDSRCFCYQHWEFCWYIVAACPVNFAGSHYVHQQIFWPLGLHGCFWLLLSLCLNAVAYKFFADAKPRRMLHLAFVQLCGLSASVVLTAE